MTDYSKSIKEINDSKNVRYKVNLSIICENVFKVTVITYCNFEIIYHNMGSLSERFENIFTWHREDIEPLSILMNVDFDRVHDGDPYIY